MTQAIGYSGREVFVVDGARTPFLKAKGTTGPFSATDLAVQAGRALLNRYTFDPSNIDEVILGCAGPRETEANIARLVALRLGCGNKVPAFTVQRNCASGMQALDSAAKDIADGRVDLVLAGGTEAMSHAPMVASQQTSNWLVQLMMAKNLKQRVAELFKFRPSFLKLDNALLLGLKDPLAGLSMGQTAQNLAEQFNISREMMDKFSMTSHQRAHKAQENGLFRDIVPIIDKQGAVYDRDDGVRSDSSLEKLAKLNPSFDKHYGMITAGNSSQVTDGAVMLLLASGDAIKKFDLPILGKITDCQWAALGPEIMGLGPVCASTPLLQRQNLTVADIDYWEINEAFAAQVLACQAAFDDTEFCKTELGSDKSFGELDASRLNIHGGAVALGHPVGASGARIVLHLLNILKDKNAERGIAAICIGGGQGGAMLVERV